MAPAAVTYFCCESPAGSPKGRYYGAPVHIPAVDVIHPQDTVIHFQFTLHNGAFTNGGNVDRILPGTHRIVPGGGSVVAVSGASTNP